MNDESQFGRAGQGKRILYVFLVFRAKQTPIKFEKPGRGKVNPGQNLFGYTRLSDESQFGRAGQGKQILYVCWLSETNANKI